ncbi:hypothetical protein XBFM1_2740022 [Xenorhabdus bovienii str. feltiae Moldova]|uniref:Uncharacterized protein n=2 Tax=Xenorhabdus bovienii TaxID=40576 RepID=A0A077PYQ2_XENBV|nr:hypothetical protein XBFM1_2740022 [Xenorhabdus bovienii str. feltiae Moldova]CDH26353.1 hypothetical protein XBKB1_590006 [Xenorhabdus bovienii str. kraussei Becker Underwood]
MLSSGVEKLLAFADSCSVARGTLAQPLRNKAPKREADKSNFLVFIIKKQNLLYKSKKTNLATEVT